MSTGADAARRRLALAEETLRAAELMVQTGHLRGGVNRAYYAAFYAGKALLATKQLDSATHAGVLSLVGKHFARPGIIGREHGRALHELFELRLESDYEDLLELEPDEVREHVQKAEAFVAAAREALSSLLGDQEDAQPTGDS